MDLPRVGLEGVLDVDFVAFVGPLGVDRVDLVEAWEVVGGVALRVVSVGSEVLGTDEGVVPVIPVLGFRVKGVLVVFVEDLAEALGVEMRAWVSSGMLHCVSSFSSAAFFAVFVAFIDVFVAALVGFLAGVASMSSSGTSDGSIVDGAVVNSYSSSPSELGITASALMPFLALLFTAAGFGTSSSSSSSSAASTDGGDASLPFLFLVVVAGLTSTLAAFLPPVLLNSLGGGFITSSSSPSSITSTRGPD